MDNKLQVRSERGHWVFTYVPAGETVRVRNHDVRFKYFVKTTDMIQAHVLDSLKPEGQFIPYTNVSRFLDETAALKTPAAVKRYFGVPLDSITMETLRVVREWVAREDKSRKTTGA